MFRKTLRSSIHLNTLPLPLAILLGVAIVHRGSWWWSLAIGLCVAFVVLTTVETLYKYIKLRRAEEASNSQCVEP
jgi:hypothetical protein